MKYRLLICLLAVKVIFASAQDDELIKIIPPSPDVAALGKYGAYPVNYYTGVPNISIPIYDLKVSGYTLPISISYHASGIKVEEMASRVGLGWSLNAGGIISRSVRGRVDEEWNGYMNPGSGYTIAEILAQPDSLREQYMRLSADGSLDTEADIFYYNFAGYSGQFYYSQEIQDFVIAPVAPLKIDKNYFLINKKWKITTEDGTIYYFDLKETNTQTTTCSGTAGSPTETTTGWMLTKIDTFRGDFWLLYDEVSYTNNSIASHTIHESLPVGMQHKFIAWKGFLEHSFTAQGLGGNPVQNCMGMSPSICNTTSTVNTYRLASISCRAGKVEFKHLNSRCDLIGEKQLDYIEVYDNGNILLKKFRFDYGYFNSNALIGSYCGDEQTSYKVRLRLDSLTEIGNEGHELPPYHFDYNSEFQVPSRISYAQDNWGYYNGAIYNTSLVPPYYLDGIYRNGADRDVNPNKVGIFMIDKIFYPTGGYTEFEFESNTVSSDNLIEYAHSEYWKYRSEFLTIVDTCVEENNDAIFCKTFTINNNTSIGGVYAKILIDGIYNCMECDPPSGALECAVLNLNGSPLTCNLDNVFLPNGEYVLRADFSKNIDIENYIEFIIAVSWSEYQLPEGELDELAVGGLRVKKITDYNELGNSTTKILEYLDSGNNSSGVLFTQRPTYGYLKTCYYAEPVGGTNGFTYIPVNYLFVSSYSNIPLGTSQGSFVGYSRVIVKFDENGVTGKSVFSYSNEIDIRSNSPFSSAYFNFFPFAPLIDLGPRRGLLLKQEEYRSQGNDYFLVKETENVYKPIDTPFSEDSTIVNNRTLCVKAAKAIINSPTNDDTFWNVYLNISEWVRPIRTIERIFSGTNSLEVITNKQYENPGHMQPTRIETILGDGRRTLTNLKYPLDYQVTTTDPFGIRTMQEKHILTPVIEKITIEWDSVSGGKVVDGRLRAHNGLGWPREIYTLNSSIPISDSTFVFSSIDGAGIFQKSQDYDLLLSYDYDGYGNLVRQYKASDVVTRYRWGYDSTLPIAEISNSNSSGIFHTSFEEDGTDGGSYTGEKYFNGSTYVIPPTSRPSGSNLKMTYWYFDGSWKFSGEIDYDYTLSQPGATRYDEVRVYPVGAQMTTYTYKPGIGISSVTDHNNRRMLYEYDSFGRLSTIRDNEGNILKTYTYHYKSESSSQ